MEIKKLYIENFKGIQKKTVIDLFGNQLTILSGPNGFGKTTIFDVIELCLRGRLERAVNYTNITKHHADYQKPFYQNTKNYDVLVKIWVSDGTQNHIILKRFDKDNDGRIMGRRANRPDSWQLLETYYTTTTYNFEDQPDYSQLQQVDQSFIDALFLPEQDISLLNLFPLFHYLQQEENIYFLKKDEEDKKRELDFLFQTQKETEELERTKILFSRLNHIQQALITRISELGQPAESAQSVSYTRLVTWQEVEWDSQNTFALRPAEQLVNLHDEYLTQVQRLIDFFKAFDVAEYNKLQTRTELRAIVDSPWMLSSIVVYHYLAEGNFSQLRRQYDTNRRYKRYSDEVARYTINPEILTEFGYSQQQIDALSTSFTSRNQLSTQTTAIGTIVADLIKARAQTLEKFEEIFDHKHLGLEPNCPLCNAKYKSLEDLTASITDKTNRLHTLLSEQEVTLDQQNKDLIITFIGPLQVKISDYLNSPDHAIEEAFFAEISERRGNFARLTAIMESLRKNGIDISNFQLISYAPIATVRLLIEQLKAFLQEVITGMAVNESRVQNSEIFVEFYRGNPSNILHETDLVKKMAFITEKFNVARSSSLGMLSRRLDAVTSALTNVEQVKNRLDRVIFDYKKTMIEKIKIPFYIYSGKILQHFQQGYGIFVDVRENTNRIRFLADQSSDHDVIHQLSTGQLAVVSIAFCLSLNKVYQVPSPFKFLAIDDPVQTLDDLNIYALIDLIRHEFSDYQLLISTHDDNVANFLSYKFHKFSVSNWKLNVQSQFYDSQNV